LTYIHDIILAQKNLFIVCQFLELELFAFFNKKEKWIGVHLNGKKIYGSSLKEIRHIIDYPSLHSK